MGPDLDHIDEQMNRDILRVLRENTALSLKNTPHFADIITELEEAVSGIFEFILNKKVEVVATGLTEPSIELVEAKHKAMMAIETSEEMRLGYVTLDKSVFTNLLKFMLTGSLNGEGQTASSQQTIEELSNTELRILRSISQRLARAFMGRLTQAEVASLSQANMEFIGADLLEQQLVILSFDAKCDGFNGRIEFLFPLTILDTASKMKNRNADRAEKELNLWAWKQKLLARVADTPVRFLAELSSAELPITQVAMLQSGDRLPMELILEKVPVVDEELNQVFSAFMQIGQEEVVLQVGPPIINSGERL